MVKAKEKKNSYLKLNFSSKNSWGLFEEWLLLDNNLDLENNLDKDLDNLDQEMENKLTKDMEGGYIWNRMYHTTEKNKKDQKGEGGL